MAIVNRDLDVSEQRFEVSSRLGLMDNGYSAYIFMAPYPCTLEAAKVALVGVQETPQHALNIYRFIVGSGTTLIAVTSAAALGAFTTSGLIGMSLPAAGSTLLNLVEGDVIQILASGTSALVTDMEVSLSFKKTQDILSFFYV